jgi:hypothetical protein
VDILELGIMSLLIQDSQLQSPTTCEVISPRQGRVLSISLVGRFTFFMSLSSPAVKFDASRLFKDRHNPNVSSNTGLRLSYLGVGKSPTSENPFVVFQR